MRVRLFSICLCSLVAGGSLSNTLQAADLEAGRTKVKSTCRVCHGLDGLGKLPDVPNLAGEGTIYLSKQLKAFRSGERTHQQMSIIAKGLSDEDIVNLAAYYAAIKVTVEVPE
ncbi:cytochrome c [Pelagibius sp. Alg239-R121]|uniref:c-type cytochrome n=1 Tax=Pelagibius sp. Alg239-R121 TaxID=2993448 RepID=UPI0024A7A403|nr:cytochrome c [Pelagibius sp. Alg239-R121]